MSEVNLNLYDVGVCYVKDWCSDSKKLASELKSQPLKILFIYRGIWMPNQKRNLKLYDEVRHGCRWKNIS